MSETLKRREVDLPRVTTLEGTVFVRVVQNGSGKLAELSEDLLAWIAEQQGTMAAVDAPPGAVDEDNVLRFPVLTVAGKGGFGDDPNVVLEADDLTDGGVTGKQLFRVATQGDGRTALGLGSAATQDSTAFALRTHTHTLDSITNLGATGAQIAAAGSAGAVRTILQLGGAALLAVGTGSGTVAAGDDVRLLPGKSYVATSDAGAAQDAANGFQPGSLGFNTATGITSRARDTASAGAAKWVKQAPMTFIGGASGRYVGPELTVAPASTTYASGLLYMHPIKIPRRLQLSALLLRINTAVASVLGRLGIYTDIDCTPGDLIAESVTDIDMNGTAGTYPVGLFSSNPWIEPGVAWVAAAFNGAAIVSGFGSSVHGGGITLPIGAQSPQNALFTTGALSGIRRTAGITYATGVPFMPTTCGAVSYSSTASPLIAGLVV